MTRNPVLQVISKIMIPVILLFALYVQFHGDFGPGGGFQAGVLFAAAFILFGVVFGIESVVKVLPQGVLRFFIASGVLIYGATGFVTLYKGGDFLDYNVLSSHGPSGQHIGILVVELGVGITVASVVIAIFIAFAERD
jgi:multicomponent Na+:H+ antiporter subunit B